MADTPLPEQTNRDAWWQDWFNHIYMDVYAHRDESQAEFEVKATRSILPLQFDHRIMDLCCGNGRHCRALRQAGFERVVGVDYSQALIQHAQSKRPRAEYMRVDMRTIPMLDERLDAVLSYFTSFGYFETHAENLSVLQEISRILRSGGYFLLDYLNPSYVRKTFEPESQKQHGEYSIQERRSISAGGDRIEKEITIETIGGKKYQYRESVRLYEYEQMKEMFESTGLVIDGVLGAFDGRPYREEEPRMILFGKKA